MYDFFIAHANHDSPTAQALYEQLNHQHSVFLDKEDLRSGDNWNKVLPTALANSKVIVIMLSKDSLHAYYLLEEIARAIRHYRNNKNWYRVVPLYLDGFPSNLTDIPYGLYQLHSLDLVAEKSLGAICEKLIKFLQKDSASAEDAIVTKDALAFQHPLHAFPIGPMVDGHLVPTSLIEAFAEAVDDSLSLQVVSDANAFRKEADPTETGSILIKRVRLPNPNRNNPLEFWLEVFRQARLHGPRMLAALVLTVQDTFFPKNVIAEKNKLLNILKTEQL